MKKETAEFTIDDWNRYAIKYDCLNALKPYQDLLQKVIENLELSFEHAYLDAACGTGNLLKRIIKQKVEQTKIFAVDLSIEMMRRAKDKAKNAPINFHLADLNGTLPFEENFFDRLTCINGLYTTQNPLHTLKEFHRVLKPGGKVIVVNPKKGYENGLVLKEHCQDVRPDEFWLNAHASPQKEHELLAIAIKNPFLLESFKYIAEINRKISAKKHFHFLSQKELSQLFEDAGLVIVKQQYVYAGQGILIVALKER